MIAACVADAAVRLTSVSARVNIDCIHFSFAACIRACIAKKLA